MNKRYSREWDMELNKLLDQYKFTNIDSHHAKLGPAIIWVGNAPYACMHTYSLFMQPPDPRYYPKFADVRPSRLTIIRCLEKLKLDARSPQEVRDEKLKKLLS